MVDKENISKYPASVVKVIDKFTIVINRGSEHGVSKGNQFLVYYVDPEDLIDPETGENLGKLEIVRGTGTATHVQPKISTIKSNRKISKGRVVRKITNPGLGGLLGGLAAEREIIEEPGMAETLPFDDVQVGDKVKPI